VNKRTSQAFEDIRTCIDRKCAPSLLSRAEYAELLEELAGDIESRLEAVTEELEG
jgi:hypothetical protein